MRSITLFALLLALSFTASHAEGDSLAGQWTYRSYHNRPMVMLDDDNAAEIALSLVFGEGIITLGEPVGGKITGVLDLGGQYQLDMAGTATPSANGGPVTVQLVGTGRAGTPTAGWEYRYHGFLSPSWENGVKQIPALTGTVLRFKQHGQSQAGYTVSFIAVKRPVIPRARALRSRLWSIGRPVGRVGSPLSRCHVRA